jgi:excisionase family DNA binding protein
VSPASGWDALGGFAFARLVEKQELNEKLGKLEQALAEKMASVSAAIGNTSAARRSTCMTLREAAETLRCSKKTIRRLRLAGEIRDCERHGKECTVVRSDVLRLASASSRKGA